MQYSIENKQKGMTFLGMVIVIVALVCIVMIGVKVTPAYIEFFSVKKALQHIASDASFGAMSKKEIETAFDKNADTGYITVIKGSDLIIENGSVTADYQVTIPIVANASVLLDFNATTAK
jgi:Domain of unknown function (DUF4845)